MNTDKFFKTINTKVLSEISRDIGQVFFASMVIGQVMDMTRINWVTISIGLFFALFSWYVSIIIVNIKTNS